MKKNYLLQISISICIFIFLITSCEEIYDQELTDDQKKLSFDLLFAAFQTYKDLQGQPLQMIDGYRAPISFKGISLGHEEKFGLIYQSYDTGNEQKIIIAFRGTITPQNWIADFIFIQTKDFQTNYVNEPGILVEKGFYDIYKSMRDTIIEKIQTIDPGNNAKLYITGHSLGGALAILLTIDIVYNDLGYTKDNVYMYNFAGPRVGNDKFSTLYKQKIKSLNSIQFVNNEDLVPTLPPKNLPNLNYRHAKALYLLSFHTSDSDITCDSFIEKRHNIEYYYKCLSLILNLDPYPILTPIEGIDYLNPRPKTYVGNYIYIGLKHPEIKKCIKELIPE